MTTSDSGSIITPQTPQDDAPEQPQMPPEAQEPVGVDADGPENLPILPVTDAVLFPSMLMPLVISGENWIKLIDDAALSNKTLALFWQHRETEHFEADALSPVGTIALLARMARLPDGKLQVLLQGQTRSQIEEIVSSEPYPVARVSPLTEDTELTRQIEGLERTARDTFKHIIEISQALPDELSAAADNAPSPGILADMVAVNLNLQQHQQQAVLNALDVSERLHIVLGYLEREREILEIGQKAQSEVSKTQREYVLRQQLEAIKRELGETDDQAAELAELRRQLDEANLPDEPRKEAERELKRLERVPPAAPEYSVARTYLDVILGVPWDKSTDDNYDLAVARQVLDEDHYDLERVKDRIIEYLAVRKLQHEQGEDRLRGPILCLVGPPGVGKTSLGQSVARALDRKFMRVALGGIRDESEIRGFRRTYVGALPGRIIQGISRIGSNNPVLMLDEVDKLTVSLQGDPAAALLELLDPEQNRAFVDRYLDVPFDLSRVLFICTANRMDTIPPALLDRMEVLELAGYTEMEKLMISRRYLVPRQQTEQGLGNRELHVTDETLRRLIREYTRESGVRNLERQIGSVFRKMATRLAEGKAIPQQIDASDLDELLEPPRYRFEAILGDDEVGVTTGLAWTPTGGDVLFVECRVIPGNGQLILTGQLGDVMRESARAAMTYARSRGDELGIDPEFAQRSDVHIHVPAGSIPKDGPSAGITIACALISALVRRKTYKHVGMTGEITLSGKVLPIGGVKEKILAAQRVGVQTVLLPHDNGVDLREVPPETREQMEIVLVEHMDEVLPRVLYAE